MLAMMAADITAARADVDELAGTITTIEETPQTVNVTLSTLKVQADTQDIGVFHESDLMCVGLLSGFTGAVPAERAVILVTCSGLSLAAARFYIESKEVDPAGFTFTLKRAM